MASSQMPPIESRRASGFVLGVPEAGGEAGGDGAHAGRAERSAAAVRMAPPEAALRWWRARPSSSRSVVDEPGVEAQLVRDRRDRGRRPRRPPRRAGAPCAGARARRSRRSRAAAQPRGQRLRRLGRSPRCGADDLQRLPEAPLAHDSSPPVSRPAQRWSSASQVGRRAFAVAGELGERLVEPVGAELVAGAVRGLALDAVLPALERAVDDRRRLAVVERQRAAAAPPRPAGSRGRRGRRPRSSRAGRTAPRGSHCT